MRRNENHDFWMTIVWIVVGLIVILAIAYQPAGAQENTSINTFFEKGCIEAMSEFSYRIHFHYTSDGVEEYHFAIGDVVGSNDETLPYKGHAKTNVPDTFKTSEGFHDDFYLAAKSEDSPYTFFLYFGNGDGSAELPLNTWDDPQWCKAGQYPPPSTPMATITPPIAQNAGNGRIPINQPIIVAHSCVIQYPKIILVCQS